MNDLLKGGRRIIIGSRGSPLAIAQANIVLKALKKKNKGFSFQLRQISTEGDSPKKRANFTGKDLFTRAIDKALKEKKIDIAVHSLKDVPAEESDKIQIAAYPKREDTHDVLISGKSSSTLATLPMNAKVGTSSTRRALQLKIFRPDVEVVEIHGNVQTRIEKVSTSNLNAVVLAKAGLKRLGVRNQGKVINHKVMLPAVGQGCLAVTVRRDDELMRKLVSKIDHRNTRLAVTAERAFSKELGGGCNTPIAALATVKKAKMRIEGIFEMESSGSKIIVRGEISGSAQNPERLGKSLAAQFMNHEAS